MLRPYKHKVKSVQPGLAVLQNLLQTGADFDVFVGEAG